MNSAFALGPYTLSMDVKSQVVQSISEPDPTWQYVDLAGHGHFYSASGERYPTLRWVSEPCTMGHGDDCDGEGHHECRACGEHIVPGSRMGTPQEIETGRTYTLTGPEGSRRLTHDEFNEIANLVADSQAAVQERCSALLVG